MDFVFILMNFVLKMMDFVLEMMDFVLKMTDFEQAFFQLTSETEDEVGTCLVYTYLFYTNLFYTCLVYTYLFYTNLLRAIYIRHGCLTVPALEPDGT